MEKINIENFGPIRRAEIVLRDINIFIGTTSSGKSTVAKLVSIIKSADTRNGFTYNKFIQLLADYNIDFEITGSTVISYTSDTLTLEIRNQQISVIPVSGKLNKAYNPIYIPAERMFFATISRSIFSLINSNVSLPKWLIDFGAKFEKARNSIKRFPIGFSNASYTYDDGTDYIRLPNGVTIRLSQASSGMQSVIPLILVIQYNTEMDKVSEDIFVIEEPELNLYPSSQKDLVEFIMERINRSADKIIITTHSPYLLTAIDNLIQAQNIVSAASEMSAEVNALVPSRYWINYDRVSCYYFDGGECRSTLDDEMKSIGPSNIDDVSIKISDTFEKLLVLKYPS